VTPKKQAATTNDVIKLKEVKAHKVAIPKKTKENDIIPTEVKKEYKKKLIGKEEKLLPKISEEGPEHISPAVPSSHEHLHPTSEFDWKLTEEQQNTINDTLKRYDMDESIWKNYILTKVHGDAQLRRMGIEATVASKPDCAIETMKFAEELQ